MRRLVLPAVLVVTAIAWGCGGEDEGGESPAAPAPPQAVADIADARLVAALGDSITAGSPRWDPDLAVREQIGTALDRRSQYGYWAERQLGGSLEFRNCGVFGERTDQIAARLGDCAAGADALVVQGGVNDIAQGRSVEQVAADLEGMVERGKELGLLTMLAEVLPWNNGHPDTDAPIRELNRLIADIGRRQSVRVLPFYEALEDPDAPGRMRHQWTIDGDHPSIAGYRRLGQLIGGAGAGEGGD